MCAYFQMGAGDAVARKYSQELQETALHKAIVEGVPLKQVADEAGVSLSTLRRWIKAQGGVVPDKAAPRPIRIVLLDREDIAPKIERILLNEGFEPQLSPLTQHALGRHVADTAPWFQLVRVFELSQSGVSRLFKLIERSGKDIPLVLVGAEVASAIAQACANVEYEVVVEQRVDELGCRLERLYARQLQRLQLRECRAHFEQLQRCCYQVFDAAPTPIAILRDSGHIYANPAYMHLYGYTDFAALKDAGHAAALLGAPEGEAIADILTRADEGFTSASVDIQAHGRPNAAIGSGMRAELTRFPGISRGVQVVLRSLDGRPELLPAAERRGFVPRQTWLQVLQSHVTAQDPDPAGLLYFRILGFDQVQKAIGYAQCDALLDEVCTLLKNECPEQGLLARFESNAITALVPGGGPLIWEALANRLHAAITERVYRFSDQSVRLRLAIGVCGVEGKCKDGESFITWAAEAAGRAEQPEGVVMYEPGAGGCDDDERALWAERVARALKDDNLFAIVYQPIVNLNGATEACYEALLRMNVEGGGEYLPGKFLPAAQQAGLMGVVDHWVVRHTAQVIRTEAARGRDVTMFVNLSRESLVSEDFCAWLGKLLGDNQVDAKALVFEVQEAEVLLYGIRCQPVLSGIRALGCAIALDHFTGCEESIALLDHLDVDFVKLDATLIRALGKGETGRERVVRLVNTIGAQGRKSIAGCVQDAESVALLWKCGVDYVQGYFLQQPSKALDYDFINGDYEVTISGKS